MILTEYEARQRWCPFARCVPVDDHLQAPTGVATYNRGIKPNGSELTAGHCIASDCMAWRWQEEHKLTEPGAPVPDGDGWEKDGPAIDETDFGETPERAMRYQPWTRSTRGLCGLAGEMR